MSFEKKVSSLLSASTPSAKNMFVQEAMKASNETLSGNGALKYSTSGNGFVDNFASISKFKEPRTYAEVAKDMQYLWSLDPVLTVKLALYIRLITRKSQVVGPDKTVETMEEVQRGQGLRNEGIMRMLWLAINHPNSFKANLPLFIAAGSWKDIITMMNLDLQYHGWDSRQLDWGFLRGVLQAGLINPNTTHLVRKYLPTIRTTSKCKTLESQADTIIGRWFARSMFPDMDNAQSYKQYRKLKSEGTAHSWQQLISKQLYDRINFDRIAGRALALLVGSKFLQNHNLVEKYSKWIEGKPTAKFTGFVFELFKPLGNGYRLNHIEPYKESTINAQFAQLVKTGKEGVNTDSKLLVVRDTSSSMTSIACGCTMSSYDIGKAMALYFSEFLTGPFANSFAEFADTCKLRQWQGRTPVDKYINDRCEAYGGTNFQSVIDLFIRMKNQGVPEQDFPTGILCVSDGEFNRASYYGSGSSTASSTNFNVAIRKLRDAGFSKEYVDNFKIILWDIPNGYYGKSETKFEDFADAPNFFYMSGYDPSAVAFILGTGEFKSTPRNAEELFAAAMDQELLNRVSIPKDGKKKK